MAARLDRGGGTGRKRLSFRGPIEEIAAGLAIIGPMIGDAIDLGGSRESQDWECE
jgi:hypothetical protein